LESDATFPQYRFLPMRSRRAPEISDTSPTAPDLCSDPRRGIYPAIPRSRVVLGSVLCVVGVSNCL
jgi:hypothetical protein